MKIIQELKINNTPKDNQKNHLFSKANVTN